MLTQLRARLPRLRERSVVVSRRQNATSLSETALQDRNNGVEETENARRFNPIGVQMLSPALHRQVFGGVCDKLDREAVDRSVRHLKEQKLWGHTTTPLPDVDFKLPPLLGSDLEEHFLELGRRYSKDYRLAAEALSAMTLPRLPPRWNFAPGWTKYHNDGRDAIVVDYPDETSLVFDVEVCVREGHFPTLATAASGDCWYSWCSPQLVGELFRWKERVKLSDLIPLESTTGPHQSPARIIVGHNVGFDRSFIREQYMIEGSRLRFLDTMSLHMCVSGLTSFQRALSMASKSEKSSETTAATRGPPVELWEDLSSLNNLAAVYKLYSGGSTLKKQSRDTFVNGTLQDVAGNFQELMTYCANDVVATHLVLGKLLPLYFERFPHPVSFAGMLEMSTAYLPVNQNWERYLKEADSIYEDYQQELKQMLTSIANGACRLLHGEAYKKDPWLWDLDWTIQSIRIKKTPAKASSKSKKESVTSSKKPLVHASEAEAGSGTSCRTAVPPNSSSLQKPLENYSEPSSRTASLSEADLNSSPVPTETELLKQVRHIFDTSKLLYKVQPFMPGYPAWYRDFCTKPPSNPEDNPDWAPGPYLISTQMRSVPKLLRLKWDGYPVHYDEKHGWGYLVPKAGSDKYINVSAAVKEQAGTDEKKPKFPLAEFLKVCGYQRCSAENSDTDSAWQKLEKIPEEGAKELWRKVLGEKNDTPQLEENADMDIGIEGCSFFRLPHKDGPHKRVGNPLAKDFLPKVSDGTLQSSDNPEANQVLSLSKMISYWKNARDRIMGQMVVWFDRDELPRTFEADERCDYGVILPRIIPAGTVTRRGVETTWLTASNAYKDRVGSELKCMIQAPKGYHIVGADVDSQELWIASIFADAHFAGMHGCTAFGWMTLQGNKAAGTDMHSHIAHSVGISRDQAKVINYARIYGAGLPFAQRLFMQFNHRLTSQEAASKAKMMYAQTKGVRVHAGENVGGQKVYIQGARKVWSGGSESHMFNKLEAIANSKVPKTPVLGCCISRALEPAAVNTNFFNSRINWVVQSSAVDYLHLMLVTMRWLMEDFAIRGRFAVSIHDEVRFLVASEDRYRAALALQVTNLLTRSFFAWRLGMRDLPQSVAFFSSIEVDTVLRKEVDMDCMTPSNPQGLKEGYGIAPGEALDIYAVLEKTKGGFLSREAESA
ncbi:DNA polymerase gamma, catalytic subunit tam [Dermacentor variabilis]|uniref:DNA polymerase gamma, catalytic subunit tam n=1 Tax=Dermacentor variabilis TaxID=34621 RepID=UPI003F5C9777